ncbi:hypothetical protein GJ496_010491 [Pomphorhynchus laevis]|nr:hypothetical protein GJ496_010491 [Pomphorhynchus laevis]
MPEASTCFLGQPCSEVCEASLEAALREYKEKETTNNLSRNENILVVPADNGGKTVIWSDEDYIQEGYIQLFIESYSQIDFNTLS